MCISRTDETKSSDHFELRKSRSQLRTIDLEQLRLEHCINEEDDEQESPSPFFPGAKGAIQCLDPKMEDGSPVHKKSLVSRQQLTIMPKRVPITEKKQNGRRFEQIGRFNTVELQVPEQASHEIPITPSYQVERMKQIDYTRKLLSKTYMKLMDQERLKSDPYLMHTCQRDKSEHSGLQKLITVLSCHATGQVTPVAQN
jgi:hypothetical protein